VFLLNERYEVSLCVVQDMYAIHINLLSVL